MGGAKPSTAASPAAGPCHSATAGPVNRIFVPIRPAGIKPAVPFRDSSGRLLKQNDRAGGDALLDGEQLATTRILDAQHVVSIIKQQGRRLQPFPRSLWIADGM